MHTIVPHLWFDKEAKEAAAFYTSVFPNSKVTQTSTIRGTPSGDCDIVTFELQGMTFMAISAGPLFKFNPSISFLVNFDPSREANARQRLDETWNRLTAEGKVLVPLAETPSSQRYGWLQDKYGLTWQLNLMNAKGERPPIVPCLLFVGPQLGRAEQAIKYYLSVFADSEMGELQRYDPGPTPGETGSVMFADFRLGDVWLAALDGGADRQDFTFNEAVSLIVHCRDQAEIDHYWKRLSAVVEAEQCGWLKDKFGLSWQVVPYVMNDMLATRDRAALDRVTRASLRMQKLDLAELQQAYDGR